MGHRHSRFYPPCISFVSCLNHKVSLSRLILSNSLQQSNKNYLVLIRHFHTTSDKKFSHSFLHSPFVLMHLSNAEYSGFSCSVTSFLYPCKFLVLSHLFVELGLMVSFTPFQKTKCKTSSIFGPKVQLVLQLDEK